MKKFEIITQTALRLKFLGDSSYTTALRGSQYAVTKLDKATLDALVEKKMIKIVGTEKNSESAPKTTNKSDNSPKKVEKLGFPTADKTEAATTAAEDDGEF